MYCIHIYVLCPQGCKDNLPKVDGIMHVVFLSLQMPSVSLLLFVGFLSRRGMKKPDHWFYCSSCEPCQLSAVAIGKAIIRRQVSAFLAALPQFYMFYLVEDERLFFFLPLFLIFF